LKEFFWGHGEQLVMGRKELLNNCFQTVVEQKFRKSLQTVVEQNILTREVKRVCEQ
jgi:hypothetical protein